MHSLESSALVPLLNIPGADYLVELALDSLRSVLQRIQAKPAPSKRLYTTVSYMHTKMYLMSILY